MPFKRPTLPELASEAQEDLAARMGAFGRLRRNVIDVLARVWAGLAHGLYGYIGYLAKQLFPQTAETYYLDRHSSWWGIYRKGSSKAMGRVTFSGTPNSDVPTGALMNAKGGQRYEVIEGGSIGTEGSVTLLVKAEAGGLASNLEPGVKVSLISPYSGVKPEAVVTAGEDGQGLVGGADSESDDLLRARLIDRVQLPPQGGTAHDYEAWAKEVDGVTRAWAYGGRLGPGTVSVTFVCDNLDNPIPSAAKVAEVQKYLNDPIRRPITADIVVSQLTAYPVNINIQGLTPDTEKVREDVIKELTSLFIRESVPGGRIYISHIREAVSQAKGEFDHSILAPTEDVNPDINKLPVLGVVTFVDAS
jgi:uncharacterized phage protein gp47/JayE